MKNGPAARPGAERQVDRELGDVDREVEPRRRPDQFVLPQPQPHEVGVEDRSGRVGNEGGEAAGTAVNRRASPRWVRTGPDGGPSARSGSRRSARC